MEDDVPESVPTDTKDTQTLLLAISRRRSEDRLLRKRWDKISGDLNLLTEVTIGKAEAAILDAAQRVLEKDFAIAISRQVLNPNVLARLRSLVPKETERLRQLVIDWHDYLDQALGDVSSVHGSDRYICAAFSLIEDHTLYLTQDALDELVRDVAEREKQTKDKVLQLARGRADLGRNRKGGSLQDEIWDGIDILALIIVLMNREGLKPVVKDVSLQDWLIQRFENGTSATMGGAAANETYILGESGRRVLVHTPFHHSQQARCAPDGACRLVFGTNSPTHPYPPLHKGTPDDARRHSLILQLTPIPDAHGKLSPVLRIGQDELRPKLIDRIILRIPNPRSEPSAIWSALRLVWKANGDEFEPEDVLGQEPGKITWEGDSGCWVIEIGRQGQSVFKDFAACDWPWLPVFQHPPFVSDDGILTIELASADEMHAVAGDVSVALLGGIQALGKTMLTEPITRLLCKALITQLQALTAQGATLHFELSGVTKGRDLRKLEELFRQAGISHISINREELVQITSEPGSPYFVWPKPCAPESPMGIFLRASDFLKKFRIESCYVHDAEMDILVISNKPDVELQRHRQAMLLAKAAVPEALLRRSGDAKSWPLILSSPAFAALFGFAREYAEFLAGQSVHDVDKQAIEDAILRDGFYRRSSEPEEPAVVVAPGIYVDLGEGVNMTGAGDMYFAIHAAYS